MPAMIHNTLRKLGSQSGQAIILFVGIFTIIAIVGAIVIDFGVWFSERRGAQTDSDLISLAGAYELLDPNGTFADVDAATQISALDNGIDPVGDLQNLAVWSLEFPDGYETDPEYCHNPANHDPDGRLNTVVLDVNHDSRAFFAEFFGLTAPDIGAHACARAGSLKTTSGLKPWAVPRLTSDCFMEDADGNYVPIFGAECIFRINEPSQVGSIRLGPDEGDACSGPGSGGLNVYRENIIEGSPAICEAGEDYIDTEPGLQPNPTKLALQEMLSNEGECDALEVNQFKTTFMDGFDDFDESFDPTLGIPGPSETFTAKACETPRLISLVIIDEFDGTGFDSVPILGFASFFFEACEVLDGDVVIEVSRDCNFSGVSFQIKGFFMNYLTLEGKIGAFDEFGTKVIRLAE